MAHSSQRRYANNALQSVFPTKRSKLPDVQTAADEVAKLLEKDAIEKAAGNIIVQAER